MPYCPLCNKPLMMVPSAFPENYCQCPGQQVTIRFIISGSTETTNVLYAGCKLNQPEPEKTPIPAGILASLEGVDLSV